MRRVHDVATARAGDKGDTSNIAVVAKDDASYDVLRETLTEARVHQPFDDLGVESVTRYDLPNLNAFNFVLDGVLDGGVTTSLRVDAHGKSLSSLLLDIPLPAEDSQADE